MDLWEGDAIGVGAIVHVRRLAITADGARNSRERESSRKVKYVNTVGDVTVIRFAGSSLPYRLEGDRLCSRNRVYEILAVRAK
jgi:hypothetical protein